MSDRAATAFAIYLVASVVISWATGALTTAAHGWLTFGLFMLALAIVWGFTLLRWNE